MDYPALSSSKRVRTSTPNTQILQNYNASSFLPVCIFPLSFSSFEGNSDENQAERKKFHSHILILEVPEFVWLSRKICFIYGMVSICIAVLFPQTGRS